MTPVNLGVPYNLVGIHNLTRDAGFHIVERADFYRFANHRPAHAGCRHPQASVWKWKNWKFHLQMAHHIYEKAPLAIAVIKEELRVLGEAHTMNSDEFERIRGCAARFMTAKITRKG